MTDRPSAGGKAGACPVCTSGMMALTRTGPARDASEHAGFGSVRRSWSIRTFVLSLLLAAGASGSAVAAATQADVNDVLRNTPSIYNGLFTAAVIKHVTDTCPHVAPPGRMARVSFFLGLYNQARGMGFSRAQIEGFVDDKAEQRRMRGLVEQHLRSAGLDPFSETEICAFARNEISQRTALGRQLRER